MVCSGNDTIGLSGFCAMLAQRGGTQADAEADAVAVVIAADTTEDRILGASKRGFLAGDAVVRVWTEESS